MTLGVDAAREPHEAGAIASLMLGGGYLLAATAPALLGLARDVSGGFSLSLWLLVVAAAILVISSLQLRAALPRSGAEARTPV
jgi:CP family cyanate transporter-like MFS transporter